MNYMTLYLLNPALCGVFYWSAVIQFWLPAPKKTHLTLVHSAPVTTFKG